MSLYGKNPRYSWGAIRNAQLIPVILPFWKLQVYVASNPAPPELAVPPRILTKLQLLGAEIMRVNNSDLVPRNWRLLVTNDHHLDYFLIRDADWRLSDREAAAVMEWTQSVDFNKPDSAILHCIRDHPKHAGSALVDGLWGGRPLAMQRRLNQSLASMPVFQRSNETKVDVQDGQNRTNISRLLDKVLWPSVADVAYCHDSVSPCEQWLPTSSRHPFPVARQGQEYIGLKYNEHQELVSTDKDQISVDIVCNATQLLEPKQATNLFTTTQMSTKAS
jgi:hypothetical protein